MVHLIFVIKYRFKLLFYFGKYVRNLMFSVSKKYNFDIIEYNNDLDHIHMLVSYQPKFLCFRNYYVI
jgi:REP element-mobilizing transposase RayT